MKKLFIREFTYRAYVYLDDEDDDTGMSDHDSFDTEIIANEMEPDSDDLTEVTPGENPLAWPTDALVYHDGQGDIMLGSVMGGK